MRGKLILIALILLALPACAQQATGKFAEIDRLLAQAERQPAQREALLREAASLDTDGVCPALHRAVSKPDAVHLKQARRENAALNQAQKLSARNASSDASPKTALGSVLSRPEFQPPKTDNSEPGWLKSIRQWFRDTWKAIADRLNKLFSRTSTPSTPTASPTWFGPLFQTLWFILKLVLVAAVLFGIGYAINLFVAWRWRQDSTKDDDDWASNPTESGVSRRQEPTFWEFSLQEAQELWAHGDQRQAVRKLKRACLVLMDTRNLLRYDESRANGEVLRELRRQGHSDVSDTLRPISRCFDRSWYGFLNVSDEEFSDTLEMSKHFREQVVSKS